MCQLVDDYADKRADKRVKKEKIRNVLKMREDLPIDSISKYTDITKELVIKIINFNSNDANYIYEQLKDMEFTLL